jgi:hypothetical protein
MKKFSLSNKFRINFLGNTLYDEYNFMAKISPAILGMLNN